jgi:hypothetical protein
MVGTLHASCVSSSGLLVLLASSRSFEQEQIAFADLPLHAVCTMQTLDRSNRMGRLGASASRDYILGTFTRYFRWCFAGSNNRTVREREAAREAFVDQGNFVQGEVKAQPVARVLTSGLENTRLSLIRLITAISDDGTYQNRAMGTGTSKRCRRSASRVRGA